MTARLPSAPPCQEDGPQLAFVGMDESVLPLVAEVEKTAYAHPWNPRHFRDSLAAGHQMQMLVCTPSGPDAPAAPALPDGRWLLGYFVAMKVLDEVHLLNITTVPRHQRQGWAQWMLQALALWARQQDCQTLWLEVRDSNTPARNLYRKLGFTEVGRRRGYYPVGHGELEDALVMKLELEPPHNGGQSAP